MSQYSKPFSATLLMLLAGYTMLLFVDIDLRQLALALQNFKHICNDNPVLSYAIFSAAFCGILLSGIPAATILMLLAGLLYSFWEAALLITACRTGVAISAFSLSKNIFAHQKIKYSRKPKFLRKMEAHPNISLLLMRLAPVPDSMINYSMSAVPVRTTNYALISLVGMIPATLMLVVMGEKLGSLSNFISYIA